jgi:hypothetical protein
MSNVIVQKITYPDIEELKIIEEEIPIIKDLKFKPSTNEIRIEDDYENSVGWKFSIKEVKLRRATDNLSNKIKNLVLSYKWSRCYFERVIKQKSQLYDSEGDRVAVSVDEGLLEYRLEAYSHFIYSSYQAIYQVLNIYYNYGFHEGDPNLERGTFQKLNSDKTKDLHEVLKDFNKIFNDFKDIVRNAFTHRTSPIVEEFPSVLKELFKDEIKKEKYSNPKKRNKETEDLKEEQKMEFTHQELQEKLKLTFQNFALLMGKINNILPKFFEK